MITILAPAYYNDWSKVKYLKESAEHFNVPIHWYGFGKPYQDWFQVQVTDLLKELEDISTDYFIYTDSSDAIISNPQHITDKLDHLGWPDLLFSIEADKGLCAGGWAGHRKIAIHYLTEISRLDLGTKNPQLLWRYLQDVFWPVLDTDRWLFQVADEPLEIKDNKVYNPRTKTFPFIVHWAGGYTDPVVGKAALIEPYWKQLGF